MADHLGLARARAGIDVYLRQRASSWYRASKREHGESVNGPRGPGPAAPTVTALTSSYRFHSLGHGDALLGHDDR